MGPGPHVCMFSDDFLPAATGVGVHLQLVAPELVRRGYRVSLATTRRRGEPERDEWRGVRLHRVATLKMFGFYQAMPSAATLRALLETEAPDLVHHHYAGLMMRRCAAIAHGMGLRQVSTYHFGPEVLTQPLPMRPLRRLVRAEMVRVNNLCDLVISPSQKLVAGLRAQGITAPITYITNPVAFGDAQQVAPAARDAAFVVLYAGRLGHEKNIGLLISAFGLLLKHQPDALLWIAGKGPEEAALRAQTQALGLTGRIRFLGFLDHATLAGHYQACDVFVLPSVQEVQPLVAMEAMWFGRPVIVTQAIAAAEEMVDPGVNGYIVDPNRADDLAARLAELAAQPALRQAMGRAGLARAQAFRPSTMVDALDAAYRRLLD